MHVSVDPTAHPPVSEMSAPAFSGTAHKLEVPTPAEPAATEGCAQNAATIFACAAHTSACRARYRAE
eukprot:3563761-Amphidinium_carterae.2